MVVVAEIGSRFVDVLCTADVFLIIESSSSDSPAAI
jgi:hypothetical protein